MWPQVPLFGSTIVPIFPVPETLFAMVHGFEVAEIPKLVDFCKDTGKIQFSIATRPTLYAGLDYLDPILRELKPPSLEEPPLEEIVGVDLVKDWHASFFAEAKIALWPWIERNIEDNLGMHIQMNVHAHQLAWTYSWLKALGFESVTQKIDDAIGVDPKEAYEILRMYKQFVTDPVMDPLGAIVCSSLDYITRMQRIKAGLNSEVKATRFPCEVGAFLIKKLTPVPESFEACRVLIDHYAQSDLFSTVEALSRAVNQSDVELVKAKTADLDEIFTDTWRDAASMTRRISGISYGINVCFSALGYAVGSITYGNLGGTVGLLAGLGFQVADKSVEGISTKASRKIARIITPSHTCTVFDFRQKYSV